MKIDDAAKILGLTGEITPETTKAAYRRACSMYHPDRNPEGLEMMKAVNAAYDVLKDYTGSTANDDTSFADALHEAIKFAVSLQGVCVEICGAWVWLSGNTRAHAEALKNTKNTFADQNGFRWAPKKKMWYFRPMDWKSSGRGRLDMESIRDKYGSQTVAGERAKEIAA